MLLSGPPSRRDACSIRSPCVWKWTSGVGQLDRGAHGVHMAAAGVELELREASARRHHLVSSLRKLLRPLAADALRSSRNARTRFRWARADFSIGGDMCMCLGRGVCQIQASIGPPLRGLQAIDRIQAKRTRVRCLNSHCSLKVCEGVEGLESNGLAGWLTHRHVTLFSQS